MEHVSLNFVKEDDSEGFLVATLDTGAFKARCHYWCPPSEFEDLQSALQTFPIPKERPLDMRWYGGCIELRIEPVDSVGHLRVSVALSDYASDWNSCRSQFRTSYGEVDRFREQLKSVLDEGVGEAVLLAS